MAQEKIAQMRAYDIADGENMLAQTKKSFTKMEALGVTLAEVRGFEGTLAEAKRLERSGGRISLDDARRAVKDQFGHYRKRADLAANTFEGPNEKLARELGCAGHFPKNDGALAAAIEGIGPVMKRHSALLAGVGFSRTNQEALVAAANHFIAERTAKPTKVGKQQAESTQRDRVFETLRYQTSYLRRVGLEALEGETAANAFHRVKMPVKAKKAKVTTAPTPAAMKKEG